MSITLPPELDRFLHEEVAAGRFPSLSDAVSEAVRQMQRQRELSHLRQKIAIADEQIARGESVRLRDDAELRQHLGSLQQQWSEELQAKRSVP